MNPITRIRRRYVCALATAGAALVLVCGASAGRAGGGTPISSCGQTVTTSAFLTQDLVCTGDGIVVGAAEITIDLKGFTIRGDGCAGCGLGVDDWGVDVETFDGVTVRNGVIRNFKVGVIAIADHVRVDGVVASANVVYGIGVNGAAASINSSTAAANGIDGILVTGDAARIKSSSAFGNGDDGIEVSGTNVQVTSSTASGNAARGIAVSGDAPKLSRNRSTGNGFAGGASDLFGLGIVAINYTTLPVGKNVALGNDAPGECSPASLC